MGLRAFTFDGTSSSDFGMFITEASPYNAPERAVEMIDIPGRNGAYALDKGSFENVEQTYHVVVHGSEDTDFRTMMSDVRNWLCSKVGYCRLSDDYNPGEYRMATYKSGLETDSTFWNGAEFDVTFDCKPQRYLLEGEEKIVIGEYKELAGTDNEPYLFRQSPQFSAEYDTEMDELVGGTVAWNQLVDGIRATNTVNGITATNNGNGTITFTGTATASTAIPVSLHAIKSIQGHKYYCGKGINVKIYDGYPTDGMGGIYYFNRASADVTLYAYIDNGVTVNETLPIMDIDLTKMFGTTIADYIYSLEQANAGAGVAFFRNLFPKPYYAYNAGELISVKTSSHDMVGFNQWDGENSATGKYLDSSGAETTNAQWNITDYIRVVPNTSYYFKNLNTTATSACICWYDADKNFISSNNILNSGFTVTSPTNACYLKCTYLATSASSVCINLSWDGERNGEYEPYVEHSYPLDDSLTLRGIPKIANGKLYYDGDTYESDGTVTRKYGIVDLGTLPWNYASDTTYPRFTAQLSGIKNGVSSVVSNIVCSKYKATYTNDIYSNGTDKSIGVNSTYLWVRDTSYTDAASFKTAMSGVYLVYELATPTTETADPFEEIQTCYADGTEEYFVPEQSGVALPVGHNTKYGKNPIVLINPTWFPSKPLLAVDGYGEIKFNNRSIVNIENVTLGEITLEESLQGDGSVSFYIDTSKVNIGDPVTLNINQFGFELLALTNGGYLESNSLTVNDSNNNFHTTYTIPTPYAWNPYIDFVTTVSTPINLTVGTNATITNTVSGVWTLNTNNTITYSFETVVLYYGTTNHKVVIRRRNFSATISGNDIKNAVSVSGPLIKLNSATANSTVSALGNPTYIDCDIGECYMIKDDSPISLNQYIDLGSDLPTLPSGDTEVTYDNTITKVEVKPNWWKV